MRLYYILGAVAVLLATPLVQSKVSEDKWRERDSKLDDERTINFKQILGLEENVFAKNVVSKMKKDKAFKLEMFAKWQEEKLSVGDIAKKLKGS
ncbi:hypothetical protein JG688_00006368 [Phytophthora aleatoria]|uniref:RxLR effector protein n=1 Tax=Phytophthora aleatoria TaxID=2496075 RepID=A0A8J5IZN0_9STRA|nr:hypothetical protein JG688_00006368 [Phytophthora aleatoria]